MKLNKTEILIEPDAADPGVFNARINESGSHQRPAWRPLKRGAITDLWDFIFRAPGRILKVKFVITYEARENSRTGQREQ